jgi:hypothetical protein
LFPSRRSLAARLLLSCVTAGIAASFAASARAETIDLAPEDRASWGMRNVFAPLSSIVLGPNYWYGDRQIKVDTTPPGAALDLFYVRANFQKRYEKATAPVTIVLPSRIEAGPRDAVTIRAYLDGHKIQETTVRVESRQDEVQLDLAPLSNALKAVAHAYFGGRGSISLLTTQVPSVRVQDREGGFTVVLNETANTPELATALAAIQDPFISSVAAQQLGEDLLVRVELTPRAKTEKVEMRSRQGQDAARGLNEFAIDLVAAGAGSDSVTRAQAALAQIQPRDVTGCAAVLDDDLRSAIGDEALSRALAPRGAFTDPYLRAAMKRLGEVSPGGVITLVDGSKLDPASPIELAAAQSQAAEAKGYLALLDRFSRELDGPDGGRETLRGLIAPELEPAAFASVLSGAQARERSCR